MKAKVIEHPPLKPWKNSFPTDQFIWPSDQMTTDTLYETIKK